MSKHWITKQNRMYQWDTETDMVLDPVTKQTFHIRYLSLDAHSTLALTRHGLDIKTHKEIDLAREAEGETGADVERRITENILKEKAGDIMAKDKTKEPWATFTGESTCFAYRKKEILDAYEAFSEDVRDLIALDPGRELVQMQVGAVTEMPKADNDHVIAIKITGVPSQESWDMLKFMLTEYVSNYTSTY